MRRVETTPGNIRVQVLDNIDEIDETEWVRVAAGGGLYTSRPWLRSLEDDPWHDVWYLAAKDERDDLLGLLPVYLSSGAASAGSDGYYDPATVLAGSDPAEAHRWRPALLAGTRTGYDGELLVQPGLPLPQRAVVLAALVARAHRLAEAWNVHLSAFMHLTSAAAAELAPVLGASPVLTEAIAVVPLATAASFEEHVAALPKRRRARVRAEVRAFADSDFTVREARLSETVGVVADLLAAHHHRYGHQDTPQMLTAHLQQQAEHLDGCSRVLLCLRGGDVHGALLIYEWSDTWYVRAVAARESLRGESAAFFNLLYHVPMRLAYERGIGRYVIGPSNLAAKVWRGALVEPRWSLLVGRGPGRESDVARRCVHWDDVQATRWTAHLAEIGASADVAAWRSNVRLRQA
ncbi:hypothetical protein [Micromonospora wenchangensis]|uniref:hypothetical protein n=1 Tax=Micromonospora wenchangensis TaxID=1185415 RepID=UPI003819D496